MFAVAAEQQTTGRGTRGRKWESGDHNVLLTIAIKRHSLPISFQYLPLRYLNGTFLFNFFCLFFHL
jgi:biotin-(acetyl-CoA carboxylase) ligase